MELRRNKFITGPRELTWLQQRIDAAVSLQRPGWSLLGPGHTRRAKKRISQPGMLVDETARAHIGGYNDSASRETIKHVHSGDGID